MFYKLAARNVRRSVRDYSVYFITLVFGVCVFYTFNALEGQSVLLYLANSQHYMVESILTLINVFSVFVSVILAAVVLYANTFMMKRRKKELGIYFLLGLPVGKVSALLLLETLIIGVAALVVGIVAGVFFSFGLSALSASLFQVSVDFLKLTFSLKAMGKTILYFGVMFLLVMLFNGASVSRCKLIDLMQASRRSEDMKEQPLGRSVVVFLIGVALIVAAYALLLLRGIFIIDAVFWLMLAMGTAGTLLFFRSLSGFLLKLCRGNKRFYYKGLNMFTLRQFNSRIHTNYLSMTVICLMLLLAIGITACAVGMNNTMDAMTDEQAPFDITVQNQSADSEGLIDFDELIRDAGREPEELLKEAFSLTVYYNEEEVTGETDASGAVALSDYNSMLALQGKKSIALAPGEHMLLEENTPFVTGGLGITLVVVEDNVTEQLPVRRQIWSANYAGSGEAAEAALLQQLNPLNDRYILRVSSRLLTYQDLMGSKVLVIFLGLYLGVTFLLASAAVLALQQLSQAADNAYRYTLLAKLGAERKLRDRSVFIQVFLAFLLPLALAIVHAIVGMTSANAVIASVGKLDATVSSAVTAAFLVVIYGAYFIATCLGCRRLARGR